MERARVLGLDIGDRWIGAALSDPQGILASPLIIIDRHDVLSDIEAILGLIELGLIESNEVGRIIIGLPISMDGSLGEQAQKVTALADQLKGRTQIPIEFRDERLSTVSARRLMQGRGKGRKTGRDDAIAAAVVLQAYLDEDYSPGG
jgi:putative Holliday junction resolvase